nr:MAG TPA_asm: hypothetical protein [Caudoviricetes sp.]
MQYCHAGHIDSGDYLQMILEWVELFFTIPLPSVLLLL